MLQVGRQAGGLGGWGVARRRGGVAGGGAWVNVPWLPFGEGGFPPHVVARVSNWAPWRPPHGGCGCGQCCRIRRRSSTVRQRRALWYPSTLGLAGCNWSVTPPGEPPHRLMQARTVGYRTPTPSHPHPHTRTHTRSHTLTHTHIDRLSRSAICEMTSGACLRVYGCVCVSAFGA